MSLTIRRLAAGQPGPVTLQLDAGALQVAVAYDEQAELAVAVLTGPPGVVQAARHRMRRGGIWHITVPAGEGPSSVLICGPDEVTAGRYQPGTVRMTVTVPYGTSLSLETGRRPPVIVTETSQEEKL